VPGLYLGTELDADEVAIRLGALALGRPRRSMEQPRVATSTGEGLTHDDAGAAATRLRPGSVTLAWIHPLNLVQSLPFDDLETLTS
jgi:hypothetical protein